MDNENSLSRTAACYEILKDITAHAYEGLSLVFPFIPEWVVARRAECLIRVCQKVNDKFSNSGLSDEQLRHCSLKLGIQFIEGASLEEDERLQELWANLLTNAINSGYESDMLPRFASIIKDLTPLDAQLLKAYYEIDGPLRESDIPGKTHIITSSGSIYIDGMRYKDSIDNLKSLNLITETTSTRTMSVEGGEVLISCRPKLTDFGFAFVDACIRDAGKSIA